MLGNVFERYEFLSLKIPKCNHKEFFSYRLRNMLSKPYLYIYNIEIDMFDYSSIYYFEHIKKDLVFLISTQVKKEYRDLLLLNDFSNLKFKDALYEVLIYHDLKDLVIPFFIWLNYYSDNNLQKIKDNMEYLKEKKFNFLDIDKLYNEGRSNTFFRLPYIQENNKDFLKIVCKFMRTICNDLTYTYLPREKTKVKKKRVGFYSERLKMDSSVLRDRYRIIENLDRNLFTVFIIVSESEQFFSKNVRGNFSKDFYNSCKKDFIFLPHNLNKSRKIIDFLELDILVYCEIGMEYKPYLLSFSRLAPVQINTWGHSETSGIDTIDYFISSELYEISNAKKFYSEKLILCRSLCTSYPNLTNVIKNFNFKTKEELGYSNNNIYSCLQASFKVSHLMEDIFASILEMDQNALIFLSISFCPYSQKQLMRIKKKLKNNFGRVRFFKTLSLEEYMNLMNISYLILDTHPFGGCNSCLEAFSLDKPVITFPSNKLSGRFTQGFYNKMDITDLITNSLEEYLSKIKDLLNIDYYNSIIYKIKDKKNILFDCNQSIIEWNNILQNLN